MNQTHIHLLINHLPVFGSILGAFVLFYGIRKKSDVTITASYYLLVIASIGSAVAYFTGEAAEETVENLQGISEAMIEQHEDASVFAFIALLASGLLSVYGLFISGKANSKSRGVAILTLVISLFAFISIARTAYLGGQIRHTEIHDGYQNPAVTDTHSEADDE
jgi:uncharacterized membrane protein